MASQQQQQASPNTISSHLTNAFPSTSNLSRQDLESLLATSNDPEQRRKDEAYFEAFFHCMPQVRHLYQQHEALLKENERKAAQNMSLQPPLEALRRETQELFDRAKALDEEWPKVQSQMNEIYKRFSPSALHFALSQAASRLNESSENMANAYVQGLPYPTSDHPDRPIGAPTDPAEEVLSDMAFVRRYKAQRTLYHKRKMVAERWSRGEVHWTD
ncbi:hypothetical protein IE53DRAFT_373042 [Violaceomyces palustris]|uniref:Uncharacterized protein n=1 Tax=Violaceomyces palustris TaxID=1673888 RepID=A0ACD0P5W3_9BASI|nr:hypothetical protein IE53DRAFT_373042 [Violaceomyces palustris]